MGEVELLVTELSYLFSFGEFWLVEVAEVTELFLVLLEEVVDDLDGGLADDVFVVLWNELLVVCGLDFFRDGLGLFWWLFLLLL